jgi:hypothetical protein
MNHKEIFRFNKKFIMCDIKGCDGVLFRLNNGADRMAERLGRRILECDKCHKRVSIVIDCVPI